MTSQTFKTSGEAWRFIQEQPDKHFRWTYEQIGTEWVARLKTDAEHQESQKVYTDLVKTHQDSLPVR
jgi:hypothetical protein